MLLVAPLEQDVIVTMENQNPLKLNLQFKSSEDYHSFLDALSKARMTDEQFRAEYAQKNGLNQDGTHAGSHLISVELEE